MNDAQLIADFRRIVGRRHVLTGARATERFRRGFRSGEGEALCVLRPGTLLEQWRVLKACVAADKIVIMQAANTGLTEGSTPSGSYDRGVVLINTRRLDKILRLNDGRQVIGFAGATLFALEKMLAPLGREPHSVIGSSCIGASIVGGVCNNSGGSLVERGPSYTELSLFAQIDADGRLSLVNHLGVDLGSTPEEMLTRLESGDFDTQAPCSNLKASDTDYAERVRDVDAETPARFNADKRRLYEASGCAGKLAVFAVRIDTYAKPDAQKVFYIGTNDVTDLTDLRRHILTQFKTLPVSAEYMEREVFNLTERYGKDTVMMIDRLGTDRLPTFFALKGATDAWMKKVPGMANFSDRFMQTVSRLAPGLLPERLTDFRDRYRHHLIVTVRDGGVDEAGAFFESFFRRTRGRLFRVPRRGKQRLPGCTGLRQPVPLSATWRCTGTRWRTSSRSTSRCGAMIATGTRTLPADIEDKLVHKLYYGHFLCHVLHQDYIVKKGTDIAALKAAMLKLLDGRGAAYPAEHNVGHLYAAPPDLAHHYRSCDPTNSFNPGIGKMEKTRNYGEQKPS